MFTIKRLGILVQPKKALERFISSFIGGLIACIGYVMYLRDAPFELKAIEPIAMQTDLWLVALSVSLPFAFYKGIEALKPEPVDLQPESLMQAEDAHLKRRYKVETYKIIISSVFVLFLGTTLTDGDDELGDEYLASLEKILEEPTFDAVKQAYNNAMQDGVITIDEYRNILDVYIWEAEHFLEEAKKVATEVDKDIQANTTSSPDASL